MAETDASTRHEMINMPKVPGAGALTSLVCIMVILPMSGDTGPPSSASEK
jgi:hypothetical protein